MIEPDRTEVERLVVRAPNWLGDAVLALPAMGALRRHFPQASLTIAAPAGMAGLFHEITDVSPDAVLALPDDRRAAVAALGDGRFGLGILFPNSFRSAWMLRRARVPERWGAARGGRGWLLTRRSARPGSGRVVRQHARGVVHQADAYRDLVRGFGIPCDERPPRLAASAASVAAASALLAGTAAAEAGRLVVFAPGAAYGQAKQWPPARAAALAARLVRERDATCVIVGAAHDRPAARAIESWLRAEARETLPRVIDMTNRTSLGALVGVLARADVVVSNDSGAMHVAAAAGRAVVALFGPTDERATRPIGRHDVMTHPVFCRPCHLRDCPIDHRCMRRITVDEVFAAVSRHLAFARRSPA